MPGMRKFNRFCWLLLPLMTGCINQKYEMPVRTYTPAATTAAPGQAIDLGLSVKWADRNVGAASERDSGGYYAWGVCNEQSTYGWNDYKWCVDGDHTRPVRYTADAQQLEDSDDVARAIWGGVWRMPTSAEIRELLDRCTWTWDESRILPGWKVKGPSGASIYLPAAGARGNGSLGTAMAYGYYWSSTATAGQNDSADCIAFRVGARLDAVWFGRNVGRSVRPVCN